MALCMSGAPASPSPLITHFSVSPRPTHLWLLSPPHPLLSPVQGAILTTMLATRNFSGRWQDLKAPNTSCRSGDIAMSDTWVPSGPGAWESGSCRGPRDWGLCSRDANLHPEVEKGQRLASYGPTSKGRASGSVCVPCLTGVLGSQAGPARGKASQMWVQVRVGLSSIPVPRGYRALC